MFNLIDKGIKGEAAIVFEGPDDAAAIMANGMSIWNLTIKGQPSCHELCAEANRPDLLEAVSVTIETLSRRDRRLRNDSNPFGLLASESLFVGQVHYGDFYNRIPNSAFLQNLLEKFS